MLIIIYLPAFYYCQIMSDISYMHLLFGMIKVLCWKMSSINRLLLCSKVIDHYKAYEIEPRGLPLKESRLCNEIKRMYFGFIGNKWNIYTL